MSPTEIVILGTLKPDGTLEFDQKPNLPPGRVTVRLQSLAKQPKDDPFFEMLKSIWAARAQSGLAIRSEEAIESHLRQMHDAADQETVEVARVQEDSRKLRNRLSSVGDRARS